MSSDVFSPDAEWTSRHTIPDSWVWVTLAQVADIKGGLAKGKKRRPDQPTRSIPYLRVANVQRGYLDLNEIKLIDATEEEIAELRLLTGDILFNEGGDRDKLGRGWVWNGEVHDCIHQNHVFRARPIVADLMSKLLSMYGNTYGQAYFLGEGKQTTNLASISLSKLSALPVPLIPVEEQSRIVMKIDSLFARSSRARVELAHIPKLIERYRQAVLEAAFRGDLTADWRASHPVSAAGSRLDTLLVERRARWQATQSSARRKTYPQPEEADYFPDIDLPEGWTWASVDQLTTEMQYGTSAKTNEDATGIPVLRMGNIVRGALQVEKLKYLPAEHDEFPALLLHDGDILFNRTNSPELVGKTAVFNGQLPRASFASYLIRLKAVGILPSLLSAYINSPYGRSWVASVVSQQVGQANVNGTKLSRLAVPLIPNEEQVILVQRINEAMTTVDAMEREMLRAAGMIDRLDQSILDKAFTGKLVAQDPNDEPASNLLARIQAARAAAPKAKRGRKAKGAA